MYGWAKFDLCLTVPVNVVSLCSVWLELRLNLTVGKATAESDSCSDTDGNCIFSAQS
jgi:hypothetical protein